jgi:biotin transport system permease protein
MLRPLWPFLLLLALWHLWTGDTATGLAVGLRLVAAVAAANLVTMTTRLSDMMAVLERLAAPLARVGLPPRRLALALALVIRFVPVMTDRLASIREAWRARSPRRPGWQLLLPATLAALDDAERVAEALRARGGAD